MALINRTCFSWSDLPLWRKITLLCCLGAFFYLGDGAAAQDFEIYYSDPHVAEPASGKIHPVHVMHGSLRYVTAAELEEMQRSKDKANLVGIPALIALFVLFTSSPK